MKVIKWLDKHFEELFLVLILVSIVLVMLYQIIRRYIFNSSLTWSEEFCRYAFTWFIFIAYSYSIRLGSELRVDAVIGMLHGKARKAIDILLVLFGLLFSAYLFAQSFPLVTMCAATGELSPGMGIPKHWVYISAIVGFGLGTVRYAQLLVKKLLNKGDAQ